MSPLANRLMPSSWRMLPEMAPVVKVNLTGVSLEKLPALSGLAGRPTLVVPPARRRT